MELGRRHCAYCALPLAKFTCRADDYLNPNADFYRAADCHHNNPNTDDFFPSCVIVVIEWACAFGASRFLLLVHVLVHGNPTCRRGRGFMLADLVFRTLGCRNAPSYTDPYWISYLDYLDCGCRQLDAARLRTRFTFPAYLSYFLLCCFITHTRMYAWTADTRNRRIPLQGLLKDNPGSEITFLFRASFIFTFAISTRFYVAEGMGVLFLIARLEERLVERAQCRLTRVGGKRPASRELGARAPACV